MSPTLRILTSAIGKPLVPVAATLWLASGGPLPDVPPARPAPPLAPIVDSDYYRDGDFPPDQVELGRLLFFDKVLSANRDISCATCHHPAHGTSDGLSLPLGAGAVSLGPERRVDAPGHAVIGRVPRNSQALFNVGAREQVRLFHDGRVEIDPYRNWDHGFWSPAREELPVGLDNVLAVQAMFPVTSAVEMAGKKGDDPVATAAALDRLSGPGGVWDLLAARLGAIPEYVELFQAVYPEEIASGEDITFVHAANAIAAFETVAFRSDGSPFDAYLESGDASVLGAAGARGMELFYGQAGCGSCHSGKLLTDQEFHAIAMPQIGPGKNDGWSDEYFRQTGFAGRFEDFGRYRESGDKADLYAFRTPSLRNVELTGPWGHAGSYTTLEGVVRHHLDPQAALAAYDPAEALLPPLAHIVELVATGSRLLVQPINPARLADFQLRDTWVQGSEEHRARIAAANSLAPRTLAASEVGDLVAFLRTLTDPTSRDLLHLVPARVPSGLPVED